MPPATQWSCLAKSALGILMGHMEMAKIRYKAGDSASTSFLGHGRFRISLYFRAAEVKEQSPIRYIK